MALADSDVLARAGELRRLRSVPFAPIVSSPLLIPRVRSAGGGGGRRVHAGVLLGEAPVFAVVVEQGARDPTPAGYGGSDACARAYNAELERAARDRLASRPEAASLSAAELLRMADELLR